MNNPFRYAYKIKSENVDTRNMTTLIEDGKVVPQLSSDQFSWKLYQGTAFLTDVFGREAPPKTFNVKSQRTSIVRTFKFSHKTNEDTAQVVYHSDYEGVRATIVFFNT